MRQSLPWWLASCTLLGAALLCMALTHYYLPTAGMYDISGYLIGRDFVNVWAAACLLLSGDIDLAYHASTFLAVLRDFTNNALPFHNWSYLPNIHFFILPFGLLPYSAALLLWSLLGLTAYLIAARSQLRVRHAVWPLLLIATAPASLVNLISGQNGFYTAALFLGGFSLLNRRPWVAGLLFGLLTIKPHLGILIPFALILIGQWRAFSAAAITALLLAASSAAIWGVDLWQQYFTSIAPYQRGLLEQFHGFYTLMMPGSYAAARVAGLGHIPALVIHAAGALLAAALSLRILVREGASPRAVFALALATILITPYGYNYDLTAVSAALALCMFSQRATVTESVLYGAVWVLPGASYLLLALHLPVLPVILMLALLHLAYRSAIPSREVKLVPFNAERAPYFDRFNRAWITQFFWLEPFDELLLTDPTSTIIAPGGEVWFAELNGTIVGTAALLKGEDGVFEFSKLGLAPEAKGRGISRLLLQHAIQRARARGAHTLRIFTHSSLSTACAIYRDEGFIDQEIPEAEKGRYARADTLLLFKL